MNLHCIHCRHIRMGALVNAATARPCFVCSLTDARAPFLDASPKKLDCYRESESDSAVHARAISLQNPPLIGEAEEGSL